MEQVDQQLKITDYNNPEKLNNFKEANEKKNKELEEKKSKPRKINISDFISKSKPPSKTTQSVIWNKKLEEYLTKNEDTLPVVREQPIAEDLLRESTQEQPQSVIIQSNIAEPANNESSEWQTISNEESKEDPNHSSDSQGYVLQTSGFLVDLETNRMILEEPPTADFDNLNNKFIDMNLSPGSNLLDSVKLNDSDLETPYTIVRKRKLHEMLGESSDIPNDEASVYKNKRSIPLNTSNSDLLNFSTQKGGKLIKKDKCTQYNIPSSKKEE